MPNSQRRIHKAPKRGSSRKPSLELAQLFRVVARTATDAIITIDERSIILFVNEAAQEVFGYSVSEMMDQEITMLMPDYLRQHGNLLVHHLGNGVSEDFLSGFVDKKNEDRKS